MFDFVHPGFLAGAALISSPIIIHLINRMRFKRVRWAAMEFLLKSQKRNRRRLIIEQLLLLALRCFLVLLCAILVYRLFGGSFGLFGFSFGFTQPQNTLHVVVLDDSLSMSDRWREDGEPKDSFRLAKDVITQEIAKNALQARTAQRLVLIHLSDPTTPRFDGRLNDESADELQRVLADAECTALHLDLVKGVEAAKALFDQNPLDRRILHLVSDFRQRDWGETSSEGLTRALEAISQAGAKINFIDAAHPYRNETQSLVQYHDNLGVVELRPETRVAAQDMPVQFTLTVANYGVGERKNLRVVIRVNGRERPEASLTLLSVPPGQTSQTLQVAFDQLGFNQVTASLAAEESGLTGDDVRYAAVEIRKQVPILLIDGAPSVGTRSGGDTYYLQTLFNAARSYQVVSRGTSELEQPALDRYPSIYLLNVRELSDKARKNLEAYVGDGGSVAFFLGDQVRPEYYTNSLYADGKGIFPAPLADRPYPSLSEPELEPNLLDNQLKIFIRNETHPIFAKANRHRGFFKFLPIRRYYPVARAKWNLEPGQVEELVTLPNNRPVRDYVDAAQEILDQLNVVAQDPRYEAYRPGLVQHTRAVRDALGDKPLHELANALEDLLHDQGEANDPKRPNLVELWGQPDLKGLRGRVERLRQTVKYGDPLVVASRYGKGKVVAFLTTAGGAWNDWAGGSPASITYPLVIVELQKYLTSAGPDSDRTVGSPLEIQLDNARFATRIHRFFVPEDRDEQPGRPDGEGPAGKGMGPVDLKEQVGSVAGGRVTFVFDEARKPGLYRFELTPRGEEGGTSPAPRVETRAQVFNVDPVEGDLRRAARDDLEKVAPGVRLRVPGSGWAAELTDRRTDASESAWFYLLFLLVLVAEQALAVHLSFHLREGEASAPAAGARPRVTAA
jgi:hypothetical protein